MNKASPPKQGEAAGRNSGVLPYPIRDVGRHETREFLPDNRGGRGGWTEWMMDFEGRRLATLRLTAPHDKGYI